jgi:hypothetical protein
MKITVVYIYPMGGQGEFFDHAFRFVDSYFNHPPGIDHETIVVCNGAPVDFTSKCLFGGLPHCEFFEHNDSGKDIGAYAAVSKSCPSDMMACFGGHTYFRRQGWLKRLAEAWQKNGPGLYGSLASYEIRPHFCTTGIAFPPSLLASYPFPVVTDADRYAFEHGPNSFVNYAIRRKLPVRLVTWDSDWPVNKWRWPENCYARGDQSNCLCYFRVSDSFETSNQIEQYRRSLIADVLTVPIPT